MIRASAMSEEALRTEKRHLSMLVDRRVADLEAEVTERARAEEALREDAERFTAIISTQRDIATAALDMNAVLNLIVARTQELTHASGAVIEMAEGDEMVYRAASGRAAPYVGLRTPMAHGLSGECVRTGQILQVRRCRAGPARGPDRVPPGRGAVHDRRPAVLCSARSSASCKCCRPELYAFGAGGRPHAGTDGRSDRGGHEPHGGV